MDFLQEKAKIQKGKKDNLFNTETMLAISEIRGNSIILKDSGIRAIMKVTGLNLDLRSIDEQQVVVEQYKRFLNGLDFPLQILIRNTYLDLTDYINYIKDGIEKMENDILKEQRLEYATFLEDINLKQGLIFIKEFYVIIPYYDNLNDRSKIAKPRWRKFLDALELKDSAEKIIQRYRSFVKNRKFLDTRCSIVEEGLKGLGIAAERLEAADMIELLFKEYNPLAHKLQSEYNLIPPPKD